MLMYFVYADQNMHSRSEPDCWDAKIRSKRLKKKKQKSHYIVYLTTNQHQNLRSQRSPARRDRTYLGCIQFSSTSDLSGSIRRYQSSLSYFFTANQVNSPLFDLLQTPHQSQMLKIIQTNKSFGSLPSPQLSRNLPLHHDPSNQVSPISTHFCDRRLHCLFDKLGSTSLRLSFYAEYDSNISIHLNFSLIDSANKHHSACLFLHPFF